MSAQLQVTGEAKIRDIQGPVVANSGVITALDGAASQYVRGDGTLADFPTSSGGGSSVSYYLNSSVSQGTIGGVAYRELSKDPIIGAGTDIAISANGYVANYLTDANDPDVILVPGGNFNCEFYFSVNNNTGNPTFYAELYKYDGTTFTLLGSSVGVLEYINQGTIIAPYYFAIPVATAALALTDRLAIRIYVNVDGRTVTLHTENGHLCQVVTTLSKGMVSLNNLTDQSQFITTGTSGTDFNIVSSGDTHTFNIPSASASNRGLITTGSQTIAGYKTFNNGINIQGELLLSGATGYGGGIRYRQGIIQAYGSTETTTEFPDVNSIKYYVGQGTGDYKNFVFDVVNITLNATRTYTLPDASGTVALTSNLSSYVPYTGATNNVDLGNFILSAGATSSNIVYANGSGLTPGTINLKKGTVPANYTGYNGIYATSTSYGFMADTGSSYKLAVFSLASLTDATTRTFTLPDLSGTLALLEGTQTFSGSKTFSVTTIQDAGIVLKNGVSPTPPTGYVGLSSNGSGISIVTRSGITTYNNNLQFTSTSSNDYNFPNVTGVMAMLEGTQTFTGVKSFDTGVLIKNGVSPTASGYTGIGAGTSGITVSLGAGGGGSLIFQSTSYNYTLPATSGTLALTSQLTSGTVTSVGLSSATSGVTIGSSPITTSGTITLAIATASGSQNGLLSSTDWTTFNNKQNALTNPVTGTGTTNYLPKFTGASTIGNSLVYDDGSGIGITGSAYAILTLNSTNANGWGTNINFQQSGTAFGYVGAYGSLVGSTTKDMTIWANSGNGFRVNVNNNSTSALILNTSGNLGLGVTPSAWDLGKNIQIGSTTSLFNDSFKGTYLSNNMFYQSAFKYITTGASNSFLLNADASFEWRIAPSGTAGNAISFTQAMTLASTGNLLVGTTTDAGYKLDVNGTGRFSGDVTIGGSGNPTFTITGSAGAYTSLFYMNAAGGGGSKIFANGGTNTLYLGTNNVERLTIASTGAATFSSSVTANGNNLTIQPTTTTTYALSIMQNTGGYLRVGRDTSTGALYGDAYAAILVSSGAYPLIIGTNDTERMRITSGGNVLIGTTTDNGNKLQVSGNTYSEGLYVATGQFSQGGSATSTFYTFSNLSSNRVFLITLRQAGGSANNVVAMGFTYGGVLAAYNIIQDNTNPALYLTITSTGGLGLRLTTGSGYGTTTWDYTITQIK